MKLRDALKKATFIIAALIVGELFAQPCRVAFLGGSITEMEGYRPRVMAWLKQTYPDVTFSFTAAGLSSTCSDTGAFRLGEQILAKGVPDLLIFEFAVNDDQDGHFTREHAIRGMEGIVRQMRRANPKAAMLMVLFVNQKQFGELRAGKEPFTYRVHREVAAHYGIPVADIGGALLAAEKAGMCTWADYRDCHPSPKGCDLGAATIERVLKETWNPRVPPVAKPLPAALDPLCYQHAVLLPLEKVARDPAWHLSTPDWEKVVGNKRVVYTKNPILWADKVGATCRFDFTGTALGLFLTAGPDAGALDVSIDGGPFVRHELATEYSGSLHYPYTKMLAEGLASGRHAVVLRLSTAANPNSPGAAARIHRIVSAQ